MKLNANGFNCIIYLVVGAKKIKILIRTQVFKNITYYKYNKKIYIMLQPFFLIYFARVRNQIF